MSFLDFAKTQYIKTVDTGEEIRMGSFKDARNEELKHFRLSIYIQGTALITTEQVRVNIYSENTYTAKMFCSNWSNISDIENLQGDVGWIGWIRIDFNRENINKNLTYYPTIELNNYTRDAQDFYIGFCHDFPFPIYDNLEDLFYKHPLQMQIFGYIPRSQQ